MTLNQLAHEIEKEQLAKNSIREKIKLALDMRRAGKSEEYIQDVLGLKLEFNYKNNECFRVGLI